MLIRNLLEPRFFFMGFLSVHKPGLIESCSIMCDLGLSSIVPIEKHRKTIFESINQDKKTWQLNQQPSTHHTIPAGNRWLLGGPKEIPGLSLLLHLPCKGHRSCAWGWEIGRGLWVGNLLRDFDGGSIPGMDLHGFYANLYNLLEINSKK